MDPILLLVMFGIPALGQLISQQMRKKFVEHSRESMDYTGREIAEMMLQQAGIQDVQVISTQGQLTDHYDPRNKTVNLSEVVYNERNVAAAAVAAHECGHAVQHATRYPMLQARSKMVPLLKLSNVAMPVLAFGGAGLSAVLGNNGTLILCIVALGLPALFSLITLPVEFDASRRALRWMEDVNLVSDQKHKGAKKALFWAAMTYVISAVGSIAQALYFARMFMGGRGMGRRRLR